MTESTCTIEECTEPAYRRSWCQMHYSRFRRHGDPLTLVRVENGLPRKHFDEHLMTMTAECKIWPYQLDADGYGILKINGWPYRVYRLACERWHGPPPTAQHQAAHGPCHDRRCWHGGHLSWRTPKQQQEDTLRDGTRVLGSAKPNARFVEADIVEIRALHAAGVLRGELATRYGVHHNTIDLIVRRISWRHVE
jgi:hypothetical protein